MLLTEEQIFTFVDYIFDLPNRQIKLLRKWLKTNSIKQPPLQYCPISLVMNPLLNQYFYFIPC